MVLLCSTQAQGEMKDPTRPFTSGTALHASTKTDRAPWVLTSTLVSAERTLATINGQVVHKGARIGNATVLEISSNSVLLGEGERRFRIMLTTPSIRTISKHDGSANE